MSFWKRLFGRSGASEARPTPNAKCKNCGLEYFVGSSDLIPLSGPEPYLCLKEGLDPTTMAKTVCPHCKTPALVPRSSLRSEAKSPSAPEHGTLTAIIFYSNESLARLDEAGALAGFNVVLPTELIPKADAALGLRGELIRLAKKGEIKVENVAEMTSQQWETFLKSRYRGRIDRWTAKTPNSTYNVVVVRPA